MKKILNSKITWIILVVILLILIIILINTGKNNNTSVIDNEIEINDSDKEVTRLTYNFELKGKKTIDLYENESYVEEGFLAIDSNNQDLSNYVTIDGTVNTNKIGKYELVYTLNINGIKKELTRIVNVLERKKQELSMSLNGSENIYLNIGSEYKELGVKAYLGEKDVSSDVKIISNLLTNQVGKYKITYLYQNNNIKKQLIREINVINIDSYFKVIESDNPSISIQVDDNIKYIILPNGVFSTDKLISYKINNNGIYKFKLYTNNLDVFEKEINVNIVDKDPPTGTCVATLENGSTLFQVHSNDTDIATYNYNDLKTLKEPSFSTSGFIRDTSYVTLTDKAGNTTKIKCETKFKTTNVITPKNGETLVHKAESDTLKVYISTKDGYYLTRIWAMDPVYQLRKEVPSSKTSLKPLTLFNNAISNNKLENKIAFAFNASGIVTTGWYKELISKDSSYNYMEPTSLIITNGKVTKNDYQGYAADYPIYYINGVNKLSYIPRIKSKSQSERKKIFQDAINSGAYNTFGFTKNVFVENSKANNVYWAKDKSALRQSICQLDTNNFIVLTSNTKTIYRQPFANYLQSLGCKTGFNLDGGGSTTIMFKEKNGTANAVKSTTRPMTMILYFTELN